MSQASWFINLPITSHTQWTAQEREDMLMKAQDGDEKALDTYVRMHLPYVKKVVMKYQGKFPQHVLEELFQEGYMGMLRGIAKYEPAKLKPGAQPESYVFYWVRALIWDYIKKVGDREPEETHDYMDFSVGDPEISPDHPQEYVSIETKVVDQCHSEHRQRVMDSLLEGMSERHRQIIHERYYADDLTFFSTIGESLGVCRERARVLHTAALNALKASAAAQRVSLRDLL